MLLVVSSFLKTDKDIILILLNYESLYYNELKSYQGIKLENFPQPEISDNEVLVPLKAFSLNHLDVLVIKGTYAVQIPLPQKSFWSADR
ncbi:MAG TPA: hypothetical protein VJZ16_05500 [Syntrophales bacterium]|nr:hypothetical protein [Syntrophales bacterium]